VTGKSLVYQHIGKNVIRKELPSKEPLTPLKGAPSPCGQGAGTLLTPAPSGFIHMTKQKSLQDIVLKAFV
jgi:hypothetical protein